jgi:PAS domain S-box-containing protein
MVKGWTMRLVRRSAFVKGAVVVALNLAALLLSLVLSRFTSAPYLIFIPVVWLCTWYGGVSAGTFSIVAAVLALDYFVIPPLYSIELDDLAGEAIFVIVAAIVGMLAIDRRRSQEVRHRMEAIVDDSEDAIVGIGLPGFILSWNKGAERVYDYSASEAIGRPISSILMPDDLAAVDSILERVRRGERIGSLELTHPKKNGAPIDLSVDFSPLRNDGGKIVGATVIVRDISKQKRTQEWLNNLSDAVENTSDIVLITDRQGVIEYVNPAFQAITGYSEKEALGQTPRLLKSGQHPSAFYENLWSRITSGQVFRAEFVNRKKNGELFYTLETIAPVKDPQGEIVRFVSTGKDITERVLAGQILKQEVEERTRELSTLYDITTISSDSVDLPALLERSLNRILSATSASGVAIYLLDEFNDTLNLSLARGKSFREIIKLSDSDTDVSPFRWVAVNNKPITAVDTSSNLLSAQIATNEEAEVDEYAFAVVPISVEARVIGVLGAIREKTRPFIPQDLALLVSIGAHLGISIARMRLITEAQRRATLIERERLAHELHDSVTQNVYSVSLLAEASRRFMAAGDAQTASHYLERLGELSQQSLKEMRLLVYELRPLALEENGLIDALQQRLDAVEIRAGVNARFVYSDHMNLPAAVEEALYRVAQEALNNSLTHAGASAVAVILRANEKYVELKVKDNGMGFEPDDAFRNGAGVGLGSMRKRVERLGGKLEICSKPGEGTRVIANLPLTIDREESHG